MASKVNTTSSEQRAITPLTAFLERYPRLIVLTGAGISAASGIPTYRDHGGRWQRNEPIQHADFVRDPAKRRRYWARSAAGWPTVAAARPNEAHQALVKLESAGHIPLLVTQNVDRLHQRAGHQQVIDLHGRLDQAACLKCGSTESRDLLQLRLLETNPFLAHVTNLLAPDGDAHVEDRLTEVLEEPACLVCGGVLMPKVVFFGGTVPPARVESVSRALEQADAMLVVGSSLMVYSGYRFCKIASRLSMPIAAINQGQTRADEMLMLKLRQDCQTTLKILVNQLGI